MQQVERDAQAAASLPSRGAWIEMTAQAPCRWPPRVAPLAGSVDRNMQQVERDAQAAASLPSRGAWIEMTAQAPCRWPPRCRSPRGERG